MIKDFQISTGMNTVKVPGCVFYTKNSPIHIGKNIRISSNIHYSTVTLLARLRGLSTSHPLFTAMW